MKYTSKYLSSIVLVLLSFLMHAQDKKTTPAPAKTADTTIVKTNRYGIRVGVDLFKLARSFYDEDYKGLEVVGDYRLTKKYFIAAELGNEDKTVDDDRLNFTTKGTYFKAGFNYNAYENWMDMENLVYIGLRYGVSSFSQTLNSYSTYNRNDYFGEEATITAGDKYSGLSAQWFEVVVGVNAKVFNNFYVGFSLRANKMMSNKQPQNFGNLYIPGFNRTYDGDFGVGFNYTVSYFLPIYKTKTEQKIPKKKK